MRALLKTGLIVLFVILSTLSWADVSNNGSASKTEDNQIKLQVNLFLSSTCPHCQKADTFFKEQQAQLPWLDVHRYFIDKDKAALDSFHQELQQQQVEDYAVPAMFFCNTHWVGFDTEQTAGAELLRGLNFCHEQLMKTGRLNTENQQFLKQLASASWLRGSMVNQPSLPVFLSTMALFDALSSCSLFCVLVLFSFIRLHKEYKVKLELGLIFVLVLGIVHFFQQENAELFIHLLKWIRLLALLTGFALIGFCIRIFYSRSTDHPNVAIPILVGLAALVTQFYQQGCTPNFALFFQQWLLAQHYTPLRTEIYGIIYHLIYLIPLLLILFFFIKMKQIQRIERYRTLMICMAWCLLLIIGSILVFSPHVLMSMRLSLFVLLISGIASFLMLKQKERLGLTWDE